MAKSLRIKQGTRSCSAQAQAVAQPLSGIVDKSLVNAAPLDTTTPSPITVPSGGIVASAGGLEAVETLPPGSLTLRQMAEARWQAMSQRSADVFDDLTMADIPPLLHDLQVHQIELELQNEELRQAKDALDVSRARYVDLYDLAPVGYCSVSEAGLFVHANLTLATLLGVTRSALLKPRRFSRFVAQPDHAMWYQLRQQVLDSGTPQTGELRLRLNQRPALMGDDAAVVWVQVACTVERTEFGKSVLHIAVTDISARKQSEVELLESEARFRTVVDVMPDAIVLHRDGKLLFVNAAAVLMFGAKSAQALIDMPILKLIHPDFHKVAMERVRAGTSQGIAASQIEERFLRLDGTVFDVEVQGQPIVLAGQPAVLVTLRDITERKQAQAKLQLAASVFGYAREGIAITDAENTIIDVNDAFTRITGYSRTDAIGQNPRILQSGRQDKAFYEALWRDLTAQGYWNGEIWNRRKCGELYAELVTISVVRDAQGRVQQYVALFSDITAAKAHQSQLEHIAHFDALTNLPNRVLLTDRLQQALAQSQRRGEKVAVAYLDLDGFKNVNDSHGHDVGDQLLMALSNAMKGTLREGDTLARIGGDEFVAVLSDLESVENCVPLLTRLLEAAASPVQLGKLLVQGSASIGVTFYPQARDMEPDQLLRQADQAMYQAKLAGKNRYQVFDAEQDSSMRVHHEGLERIRLALAQGEFLLHYQPKVNMRSGKLVGAEALIRWQHPERGLLGPATFLPVIEEHPLAVEVGEWVIDTALSQIERWHAVGLNLPVSVNIGARQLQQGDFVERLQVMLARHDKINPASLELEVLETSALADMVQVSQVIEDCAKFGVKFALDDFGTGYSSLTYLKRLRVAQLKIDQSFVRDMLDDPDDLAILEGVIGLAAAFKREVIAEGVETVAHGTLLLQLGCELAQGYGIAKPMPAEDLPSWAATWQPDEAWSALTETTQA